MDALELLHTRVSAPRLVAPGPTDAQLEAMFRAAVRAPDHGCLKPYRFLTVAGEDRQALGRLFLEASLAGEPSMIEARREKILSKPLRAPLIVVVIASLREHPKVPPVEQRIAAGAAAHALELAAFAQGVGAMWRTGAMAYAAQVKEGLGLTANEEIIGYLYLGTPGESGKKLPCCDPAPLVGAWHGEDA